MGAARAGVNEAAKAVSGAPGNERLREIFGVIDRDGSGGIDFEEFKAGVHLMGFLEKRGDSVR